MADALAIVGLASAMVQFVDFSVKVLGRLNEYRQGVSEVPKVFEDITILLPVVISNIEQIKNQVDVGEMSEERANIIKPVIDSCVEKTKQLEEILETALPVEKDTTWRRGKKAIISLKLGNTAQQTMSGLASHLQHLLQFLSLNSSAFNSHSVVQGVSQSPQSAISHMGALLNLQTLNGLTISSPSGVNVALQPPTPNIGGQHERGHQPCFMVKFAREENFTGREDVMREIDRRFLEQQQRCVAIAGVGGVGKSQIAIEYCYRYRHDHPEANIFWVHASNPARFAEAYHKIAIELALTNVNNPGVDALELVKNWLCNDANGPWLLVLDNADDIEAVFGSTSRESAEQVLQQSKGWFSYLPKSAKGSMIVTTRDRRIGERLAKTEKPIFVLPFGMTDAMRLLQKTLLEDDLNSDHSTELLEAVDFLPMAITQAGAFIRENGISVLKYLEYLRAGEREAKDLLAEAYHDPGRDPESQNSVFQTWKISLDIIRKQNPRAIEILSVMAVLDRQAIQENLLRRNDERDRDFDIAIGMLKAFYLITEEETGRTFGMHRLIQLLTQRWLELEGTIEECQRKALTAVLEQCTGDYVFSPGWGTRGAMIPQVRVVLDFKFSTESFVLERAVMLHRLATFEVEQGCGANAEAKAHESLATIQKLEGDHPMKAIVTWNLVHILCSQRKIEEAAEMAREELDRSERAFGSDHPRALLSRFYLAVALLEKCEYVEAEALLRQSIATWTTLLSLDNTALGNRAINLRTLAEVLDKQNKHEEAEETIRQAIDGHIEFFGAKHPYTTCNRSILASILQKQCKWEAAGAMARQVLDDFECTLGSHHISTILCLSDVAIALERQLKLEEAEKLRRRVFHGLESSYGPKHRETIYALKQLAYSLQMQHKYAEAEETWRRVVPGLESLNDPEHEQIILCRNFLAQTLLRREKFKEAEVICQQVVRDCEAIASPENPLTFSIRESLAFAMLMQGKSETAEAMYRQLLDSFPEEVRSSSATLDNMAEVFLTLEKYEEAESWSRQAIDSFEKAVGPEHPYTLVSLTKLASALEGQSKYEAAEAIRLRVFKTSVNNLGSGHLDTLIATRDLACVLDQQKKHLQAGILYRQVLRIAMSCTEDLTRLVVTDSAFRIPTIASIKLGKLLRFLKVLKVGRQTGTEWSTRWRKVYGIEIPIRVRSSNLLKGSS